MRVIEYSRLEVIEQFSRCVPNAEKMIYSWVNDSLEVYFDEIYYKRYSINNILTEFEQKAKEKGVKIQWK